MRHRKAACQTGVLTVNSKFNRREHIEEHEVLAVLEKRGGFWPLALVIFDAHFPEGYGANHQLVAGVIGEVAYRLTEFAGVADDPCEGVGIKKIAHGSILVKLVDDVLVGGGGKIVDEVDGEKA